jgi:hypothetical protein
MAGDQVSVRLTGIRRDNDKPMVVQLHSGREIAAKTPQIGTAPG